jgi:hypothetical protein
VRKKNEVLKVTVVDNGKDTDTTAFSLTASRRTFAAMKKKTEYFLRDRGRKFRTVQDIVTASGEKTNIFTLKKNLNQRNSLPFSSVTEI